MRRSRSAVFVLLFALTFCLSLWSQSDRGSITGTVTDSSGAVVPNAKVTAVNTSTGLERSTNTGPQGTYTLQEMPAAPYKVTVEAQGFRKAVQELQVAVQATQRADFALTIGSASEVTTVTTEAPIIQTETSVSQTNVSERQVRQLPLQVSSEFAGRTPLSFIFLDSTVTSGSSDASGRNASIFRVNGGQAQGTSILIDGANTQRAQNGTFFSEVAPGPDAFQEFTISTSNYSAEFGGSSGGVVNFTLKSGTNAYHGEAYDLLKNEDFNANSYANNFQHLPRNPDKENDFGFQVGGPVWIPKVYKGVNRTFFFFNYEGYKFKQGENALLTVPTAKMRTGDFSELLTDPYVLSQFGGPVSIYDPTIDPSQRTTPIPGNRLDLYLNPTTNASVIDPAGLAAIQKFPMPTSDGVYHNYRATSFSPTDMNNYIAKMDQVISQRQHLSGSYTYRVNDRFVGGFPRFPSPYIAQDVWHQQFKSHFARAQYDFTITPNILNHLNLAWNRADVANMNVGLGHTPSGELGMPTDATQDVAFPRLGFPGYGDPVTSGDPRAAQSIGSTFFSDHLPDNTVEISDGLSFIKGRHSMKFGAGFKWQQLNVAQFIDPGGSFNFRADQTGSDVGPNNFGGGGGWPLASLITGATEFSFQTLHSVKPSWRYFVPSFYAQDDIKVTPKLTLNVGIRYEIPYPRTESHNFLRGFDPTVPNPDPAIGGQRLGALVGAGGQGGLDARNKGLVSPDYSDFGPRFGFAYSLDTKTVVRGGIGLYYAPLLASDITSGLLGYNTTMLHTPNGRQSSVFLKTYPAAPTPNPAGQFLNSDVDYFDPNFKLGRTVQYSFDMQHELPGNMAVTLGYVGSHGTRLRSNFKRLNAIPLNDLKLGFPLLNESLAQALLNNNGEMAYASSVGVTLPASTAAVYPGFNGSVAQALRPFPQYNQINNQLEGDGISLYNGLNAKLEKRFSQGLQFGAAYTWSKLITNASEDLLGRSPINNVVQNPFDIRSLRTVSPNSAAHVFVVNYLYELPFGRGKMFLSKGGVVDKVVGGWQINGIQRYQSGLPIAVLNGDGPYTGDFLNLVGYYSSVRLNLTGAPILASGPHTGLAPQILNPAAFANPSKFNNGLGVGDIGSAAYASYYADPSKFFGNAPPVISGSRTSPFYNEDMSLMKRTTLTERFTLEFRSEFFNIFNRHRYGLPDGNLQDSAFGQAAPNAIDSRRMQLGLKLIY